MFAVAISRVRLVPRRAIRIAAFAVIAVLVALVVRNLLTTSSSRGDAATVHATVPQNAAMENTLGIRLSRVAVVGDGGLITVSYVVIDSQKALEFQTDLGHPPLLTSESRTGGTKRVSLMRQGHNLRDGQTYYLVYENTRGVIHPGEKVTITKGSLRLAHVPVL
jgi:hypothetical protein